MTAVLTSLAEFTDDELAGAYDRAADDAERAAVLAEFGRRDARDRMAKARRALAGIRHEAECAVQAQYLAASEACAGRLLSRPGMAAGTAERDLWRMPADQLARFGSEELLDHFKFVSPRITVASYIRQHAAESRAARTAALDQAEAVASAEMTDQGANHEHDQHDAGGPRLAHDEPGPLRHQPPAAEAPAAGGRGLVLGGRRGGEHAEAGQHAGAGARRPGRPAEPAGRPAMSAAERVAGYFARGREQAGDYMMWAEQDVAKATGRAPQLAVSYADRAMRPLRRIDLWPGRMPHGDVTLLYGDGAVGKGRMICDLVARVTTGRPMPLCTEAAEAGSVILVQPEDDPNEEVAWRLRGAGADLTRCYDLTRLPGGARFKLSADGKNEGHVPQLRTLIDELEQSGRNPRLVVIDPLAAVVGWGSISTNAGARRLIEPLQDLAKDTGVAILVVAHTVKSGQLQGSAGLPQALRLVFKVSRDRDNMAYRVLSLAKGNNVGALDDIKYTVAEDDSGAVRVIWQDRQAITEQRQAWRDRLAASQRRAG